MSKRFSESSRWDDPWYRSLKPLLKNFWDFLCMRPDAAGVWKPDWEDIKFRIGGKIDSTEALNSFNEGKNRIHVLNNGYWQVLGWVQFQFGENLNEKIGQHKASILLITKYVPFGYLELPESYPKSRLIDSLSNSLVEMEEEKEVEKETTKFKYLGNEVFKIAFKEYLDMRKKIRKPATKRAEEMALTELHMYQIDIATKMLNNSIMNSWCGVFPLKTEKSTSTFQNATNYDQLIESSLGKIATKDMIKKVMAEIPENLWWKISQYLSKRYPGGGKGFTDAEREMKPQIILPTGLMSIKDILSTAK